VGDYRAIPFSDSAGWESSSRGWLIQGPGGLHGHVGVGGRIALGGITMTKGEAEAGAKEMNNKGKERGQ